MKTKFAILAFGLLPCMSTFAQKPGGQLAETTLVYENDELMLRDLVKRQQCEGRTTRTLLKELQLGKELEQVLSALRATHPYMAYRIQREIYSLNWCITSRLAKVKVNEPNSVTHGYLPEVQVAIRDIHRKKVYLDTGALNQIAAKNKMHRVMTLIHATLHSWPDIHQDNRNGNIRTLTHLIYANYKTRQAKQKDDSDFTENFNATLSIAEALPYFESTTFGRAFSNYIEAKSSVERALTANAMIATATNLNQVIEVMTKELVRPSFVFAKAFSDCFFDSLGKSKCLMPGEYRIFDAPVLTLLQMGREVDFWNGNVNEYRRAVVRPYQESSLGACKVVESVNLISNKVEVYGSWALTVQPKGSDIYHKLKLELNESMGINFWGTKSILPKLEKHRSAYYKSLADFVQKMQQGFCDSTNNTNEQFLK